MRRGPTDRARRARETRAIGPVPETTTRSALRLWAPFAAGTRQRRRAPRLRRHPGRFRRPTYWKFESTPGVRQAAQTKKGREPPGKDTPLGATRPKAGPPPAPSPPASPRGGGHALGVSTDRRTPALRPPPRAERRQAWRFGVQASFRLEAKLSGSGCSSFTRPGRLRRGSARRASGPRCGRPQRPRQADSHRPGPEPRSSEGVDRRSSFPRRPPDLAVSGVIRSRPDGVSRVAPVGRALTTREGWLGWSEATKPSRGIAPVRSAHLARTKIHSTTTGGGRRRERGRRVSRVARAAVGGGAAQNVPLRPRVQREPNSAR